MIDPIPDSAKSALKQKRTYYKASIPCAIHNTSPVWANNGLCMACVDLDGKPHLPHKIAILQAETGHPRSSLSHLTDQQYYEYRRLIMKGLHRMEALQAVGVKEHG